MGLVTRSRSAVTIDRGRQDHLGSERPWPVALPTDPTARRTLLGAFAKPGRPTLTIDDFDAMSDELWAA
jgi:hypothetical protein